MNILSVLITFLESNSFSVYLLLFATFVVLLVSHKEICVIGNGANPVNDLSPSYILDGVGNKDRDLDDEDDGGDVLVPAIPEDTPHILYRPERVADDQMIAKSREFYEVMAKRRTVRTFSDEPIPQEVIDNIVRTAGTSPSGAHTEPWTFVVVQDLATKSAIRSIVEEEEELNYRQRMSRQWVVDLKPFATQPCKPYLTEAPVLLLLFRQTHSFRQDGNKRMHYYSQTSVAIAAGFILAAVQNCGLVALTSTPLNCNMRLRSLLMRPANERLELLLPIGRPHTDATVPQLQRKPLHSILVKY